MAMLASITEDLNQNMYLFMKKYAVHPNSENVLPKYFL